MLICHGLSAWPAIEIKWSEVISYSLSADQCCEVSYQVGSVPLRGQNDAIEELSVATRTCRRYEDSTRTSSRYEDLSTTTLQHHSRSLSLFAGRSQKPASLQQNNIHNTNTWPSNNELRSKTNRHSTKMHGGLSDAILQLHVWIYKYTHIRVVGDSKWQWWWSLQLNRYRLGHYRSCYIIKVNPHHSTISVKHVCTSLCQKEVYA